jgi:hypothetical protein
MIEMKQRFVHRADRQYLRGSILEQLEQLILRSYTGARLEHYLKGLEFVKTYGWPDATPGYSTPQDTVYRLLFKVFVKDEPEHPFLNWMRKGKYRRARLICPMVLNGPGLDHNMIPIALEGAAMCFLDSGKKHMRNSVGVPAFVTGRTLREMASDLLAMGGQKDVWVKLDATSFDGSLTLLAPVVRGVNEMLINHHWGMDPLLPAVQQIYVAQNHMYMQTQGLKAYREGMRASGTWPTSHDNQTTYVVAMQTSLCEAVELLQSRLLAACDNRVLRFGDDYYCAGDDTVYGFDRAWFDPLPWEEDDGTVKKPIDYVWRIMLELGLDVKDEGHVDDMRDVEFCRMKIVETSPPVLCKSPISVLDKLRTRSKYVTDVARSCAYMSEVCCGYNGAWGDVPVVGAMARCFGSVYTQLAGNQVREREAVLADHYLLRGVEKWDLDVKSVTDASRRSLARVWGVSVEVQLYLESVFNNDDFRRRLREGITSVSAVVYDFSR